MLAPLPLAALANVALRESWARVLTFIVCGVLSAATALLAVGTLLLGFIDPHTASALGAQGAPALAVAGGAALACLLPEVRSALARAVPIDAESPVHLVALVLTIILFGLQLQSAFSGALSQEAGSAQPLGKADLIAGEIPFLLVAAVGVGLFVRRSPKQVAARLGYSRPAWWHVTVALAAAGLFFALGFGLDWLGQQLTPGTAKEVSSATNRIFGQLTMDPVGVATIAITAGICEEALFRGALQPRLGILWTSIVFASVHTQYGLSFDALAVLILAIGLGLLRRFLSTTSSTVCHVTYDFLAGFGLSGAVLPWAGGIEVALIGVSLAALAGRPRGDRVPEPISP